jgi:hypothetical protein
MTPRPWVATETTSGGLAFPLAQLLTAWLGVGRRARGLGDASAATGGGLAWEGDPPWAVRWAAASETLPRCADCFRSLVWLVSPPGCWGGPSSWVLVDDSPHCCKQRANQEPPVLRRFRWRDSPAVRQRVAGGRGPPTFWQIEPDQTLPAAATAPDAHDSRDDSVVSAWQCGERVTGGGDGAIDVLERMGCAHERGFELRWRPVDPPL